MGKSSRSAIPPLLEPRFRNHMSETLTKASAGFEQLEAIAKTVLHEGSLLYPYRRESQKNKLGWHFGSILPPGYCSRKDSGDSSVMQTECLAEIHAAAEAMLHIKVKFLQIADNDLKEREFEITSLSWSRLRIRAAERTFQSEELQAAVHVCVASLSDTIYRLTVRILNTTGFLGEEREEAVRFALISTHTLLRIEKGRFHSLIDSPPHLKSEAQQCRNIGTWPVLAGSKGLRDQVLSSPFILYDHPQLAPESKGDWFDCTEIDELLTLRILTLTPEEQAAMDCNPRGATLLEKVRALSGTDEFLKLHGAVRENTIQPGPLRAGDRVTLKPKRRADIFDVVLTGKIATVTSIEQDAGGQVFACVTIDDDPGKDLGYLGQPGHRFFFGIDEMEPLK